MHTDLYIYMLVGDNLCGSGSGVNVSVSRCVFLCVCVLLVSFAVVSVDVDVPNVFMWRVDIIFVYPCVFVCAS